MKTLRTRQPLLCSYRDPLLQRVQSSVAASSAEQRIST